MREHRLDMGDVLLSGLQNPMKQLSMSQSILLTKAWKTAGALVRLKGITMP